MGAAALLLACSAVLSRLMGLVRDKVISWQFGAGAESDLYFAAFVVPDVIGYLLAGGFMSITIIPLLAERFREDEEDAWRFFSCVFTWMATLSLLFTLVCILCADRLAVVTAPGFSPQQQERLAFFMRVVLPAQVFFLSGACFTAILYLRRQFAVPAVAPLLYNGGIIACGVLLPMIGLVQGMTGYCIGVTLGAGLGAFILPMTVAARGGLHLRPRWSHPLLGKFFKTALPLMLGQTVIMLDEQFLRIFGSLAGEGTVSLLNYARRIAQAPVGLVGQAAAAASYPFLVGLLAAKERERFIETLALALKTTVSFIVPCAMCMTALSLPLVSLIFQGGRFGPADTIATVPLTCLLLAPTPFWVAYMVLVRGYYAQGDTVTPAVAGTVMTLVTLPCYALAVRYGGWAIALVSATSVPCYVLWLMGIWRRRQGGGAFKGLGTLVLRSVGCSLPGGVASWWVSEWLRANLGLSALPLSCVCLVVGSVAFAVCFLPMILVFEPHMKGVLLQGLGRFGRRWRQEPADGGGS